MERTTSHFHAHYLQFVKGKIQRVRAILGRIHNRDDEMSIEENEGNKYEMKRKTKKRRKER